MIFEARGLDGRALFGALFVLSATRVLATLAESFR
jgi:hypothetical protein